MIGALLILSLLADVRADAWSLLHAGHLAQAEVLVLEANASAKPTGEGTPNADVLLVARLTRGDSIGAATVLLEVLEQLDRGEVPAKVVAEQIDTRWLMPWGLAPVMPDGADKDVLLQLLATPIETSERVDGVRGALWSMVTLEFDPAAQHAPTPWRDAALALAGDDRQRRAARGRLERTAVEAKEQAWRLHIIGRSHLLEDTPGSQRRGLVHLARIAAENDLREAHPRLALHALRTLIEHTSGNARERIRIEYEALRTILRTRLEKVS